jgi:regulator of replication initiation timing
MKKVVFFISAMMVAGSVFSQSATVETVQYNKMKVPGVCFATPDYDVKTTAAALKARLEKDAKLKGSNANGFRFYQAQPFVEFGTLNYDIYIKVAAVGKKKNLKTVIYLLVSKGNENFESAAKDQELTENAKRFLNDFVANYLRLYDTQQKIQDLTKTIKKLEKENKSLNSNKEKLKKQTEENEKEIAKNQSELQKAKEILNSLKEVK